MILKNPMTKQMKAIFAWKQLLKQIKVYLVVKKRKSKGTVMLKILANVQRVKSSNCKVNLMLIVGG